MEPVLLWLGQDQSITSVARVYITYSIPELFAQGHLQRLRTFLRTQNINRPLTISATCAMILHLPINYFFSVYLNLGVKAVALASALNSLNINLGLIVYLILSKTALKPWDGAVTNTFSEGWWTLLAFAGPSVLSVCLEWCWYEIVMLLCGLLSNPEASVVAMDFLIQTTSLLYAFASSLMKDLWGRLYTDDPCILALTSIALPILGFCELGNSPQTAACGILIGSAPPKMGCYINFGSFYLIGLPVAALLGFKFKMGFVGLWFGLAAAQASCLCMMVYTLVHTDWKHQATRAKELTQATEGQKNDLEANFLN
ncbi:hypothetical protein TEA_026192 [Camellia sinensis var. sinensis]|uniref:Protein DETOXIFICATION n=1 Tax=Camellia sinensis var. sinensis TaxID=542762 RepID=A0A4S4F2F8_CAMSN|nr:hypothetical protein TEA_026192 [Camellia sinensis var. sinensis]